MQPHREHDEREAADEQTPQRQLLRERQVHGRSVRDERIDPAGGWNPDVRP